MPRINPVLDARSLTDYSPACVQDEMFMQQLKIQNTRDFKNALMSNGEQIMQLNSQLIQNQLNSLSYE
jgi:hypothetical protein